MKRFRLVDIFGGGGTLSWKNGEQEVTRHAERQTDICDLGSNPPQLTSHKTKFNRFVRQSLTKGGSKAAFTLAEVLITLGIIGVVVALTLPSLIQHYKK